MIKIQKENETKVEKIAFIYPRLVRTYMGSREIREPNYKNKKSDVLILTALGLVFVPTTVVCAIPALTIRNGRKVKRKITKITSSNSNSPDG